MSENIEAFEKKVQYGIKLVMNFGWLGHKWALFNRRIIFPNLGIPIKRSYVHDLSLEREF